MVEATANFHAHVVIGEFFLLRNFGVIKAENIMLPEIIVSFGF